MRRIRLAGGDEDESYRLRRRVLRRVRAGVGRAGGVAAPGGGPRVQDDAEHDDCRSPIWRVSRREFERDEYERRVMGAGGDELEQARAKGRSLAFEAAMEEALRRPAGAGAP